MRSHLLLTLLILALTLASGAAVLLGAPPIVGLCAGLLLVFALPGAALSLALPADVRPRDLSEGLVLAFGLSVALSMLCFWLASQMAGPGIIARWLVVESALIILLSFIAEWQGRRLPPVLSGVAGADGRPQPAVLRPPSSVLRVALVLAVAAVLRFASLGYGEFYDDELDVVQSARSALLGQTNVIFEHRKGPTEIWFAAVAAGTSIRFDETAMRLPFALVSLGAIAATTLLGEELFGKGRGLLAGLLLGGEGIFLAFSRMVQYQSIVLLMVTLTVWCALRFWRAQNRRAETFYLAVGAFCWSFGTLTHWDGALVGVVLAYVVWSKWRIANRKSQIANSHPEPVEGRKLQITTAVIIAACAVAIPAIFYLQLFLNPQSANLKQYAGERIGFSLFNGAPAFMLHATFYDASPFIVALLALVGVAVARSLPRWGWLVLGLLAIPFVWPDFLQLGAFNLSLVVFITVLFALLYSHTSTLPHKMLFIWLFAYFIVYAFVIKSAGLHFYTLMPALALLAVNGLTGKRGTEEVRPVYPSTRLPVYLGAGLLLLLAYTYDYAAYIREQPEYALTYPQHALVWAPTFYRERPRDFFFGFPYRYGWNVVGELYRRGVLRGKFETNETYLVTDWYARDIEAARNDEARYYFRVDDAPRGGDAPPGLAERFHLLGEVRVHGEPKIHIYENNRYGPLELRVFNAEDFPTSDPNLLARSLTYKQAKGDDRAFRDAGRFLDQSATTQDVIVLDSPLQDAIIPYYYRGAARIVAPTQRENFDDGIRGARMIYASLWASGRTEQWLARSAFPIESRWFGSVRVATYAPPLVTVATTTAGAAFGDSIRLESFAFAPTIVRGGEVVRLELNWRMVGAPIATRYKIFVHVLDASGNVIAQRDAEPMADLAPTTTWKVGEPIVDHHGIRLPANVPPQSLRIAVGFYDPETNERLPVRESGSLDHANGAPLSDGRLLFDGLRAQ